MLITMDLDFTAILARTSAKGPSVVQIRLNDVGPAVIGDVVVAELRKHRDALMACNSVS